MELKLNLFVHGVPKGQKIWGPQEEDRIFLESFYSRKPDVENQLQVDILKIGGKLNCYYTYLRGGNILDKDNRQGSYFALTIRVNAFYNDLFNMFNILDATYNKLILNAILKSNESSTKFIIEDFQQSDKKFQDIEKEIVNYLSSFSDNSDIISLDNFATNSKSESIKINLLECNNKSVLNYIKQNGNISISPFYSSRQIIELTRKKDEEIKIIKTQAEQELLIIKKEFTSADKTISELNKQLEGEKRNVITLKDDLKIKNETLLEYKELKQKLDSKLLEIKKNNNILSSIKQLTNGFTNIEINVDSPQPNVIIKEKHIIIKWDTLNKYLPFVNLILIGLVLLAITFSKYNSSSIPAKNLDNYDKVEKTKDVNTKASPSQSNIETSNTNESGIPLINESIMKARIDIKEFTKPDSIMKVDNIYHITIKDVVGKGEWKTNGFKFNKDSSTIKPKKTGTYTIEYVIKDNIVASRTIIVVK